MNQKTNYSFRNVAMADLPIIAEWLRTPEVSRWYDDPNYIEDIRDHLNDQRIRSQLVLFRDRPIAYAQDYDIHAWPAHPLSYLPVGSRGIDTFIGTSADMNNGHGSKYLMALASNLFSDGAPALGIDPHPENAAAIKAYGKAGFLIDGQKQSDWGPVIAMSCLKVQRQS